MPGLGLMTRKFSVPSTPRTSPSQATRWPFLTTIYATKEKAALDGVLRDSHPRGVVTVPHADAHTLQGAQFIAPTPDPSVDLDALAASWE